MRLRERLEEESKRVLAESAARLRDAERDAQMMMEKQRAGEAECRRRICDSGSAGELAGIADSLNAFSEQVVVQEALVIELESLMDELMETYKYRHQETSVVAAIKDKAWSKFLKEIADHEQKVMDERAVATYVRDSHVDQEPGR